MTAHPVQDSETSSLPLVYGYLHAEEPDESETGLLRGEIARHRTTRGGRSATVNDTASGARDDDRDGSW